MSSFEVTYSVTLTYKKAKTIVALSFHEDRHQQTQ